MQQNNLYAMNSFFINAPQRKWTWVSPDGVTKNKIDLIISNTKNMIQDVTVLNNFSIGSDHRAVRAKIVINIRKERSKLVRKTASWTSLTAQNAGQYAQLLNTRLTAALTNDDNIDIEETNRQVTIAMKEAESECKLTRTEKREKLSRDTKNLMKKRRDLKKNTQGTPHS